MDWVVDVGNTETVVGIVDPETRAVTHSWRFSNAVPRTADEFALLLDSLLRQDGVDPASIRRSVLGSVVPAITRPLSGALERLVGRSPFVVSAEADLPIRLEVDDPRTVGADRIVNTLGAKELFGRDTIAVDLGTATTFDCITADGVFLGGVIAPGLRAGIEWLARRAAKLPTVEMRPPDKVIGTWTEACMQSGVFYSAIEGIDGIVDRIRDEWASNDLLVVATGGYATSISEHCRTIERVEPFLTLQGLSLAGEYMDVGDGGRERSERTEDRDRGRRGRGAPTRSPSSD